MISSWLIPAPSQPSTSQTVIRKPHMQGWPDRLPGSIVMRFASIMSTLAPSESITYEAVKFLVGHWCVPTLGQSNQARECSEASLLSGRWWREHRDRLAIASNYNV